MCELLTSTALQCLDSAGGASNNYPFNGDANDSTGTKHGVIAGGVTVVADRTGAAK